MPTNDPYNLNRFVTAQNQVYNQVISELKNASKRTHWMWFIFPQVAGLGRTETSLFYAIHSKAEAIAYLEHPVLGARLTECAQILLNLEDISAKQIFGSTDSRKLRSSMTLFASLNQDQSLFSQVLDKYFYGSRCGHTEGFLS
jgi:uncharacterized protein (DUF1810 family)